MSLMEFERVEDESLFRTLLRFIVMSRSREGMRSASMPGHQCTPSCPWTTDKETKTIHICVDSGNFHYCGHASCSFAIEDRKSGVRVCPLTARVLGQNDATVESEVFEERTWERDKPTSSGTTRPKKGIAALPGASAVKKQPKEEEGGDEQPPPPPKKRRVKATPSAREVEENIIQADLCAREMLHLFLQSDASRKARGISEEEWTSDFADRYQIPPEVESEFISKCRDVWNAIQAFIRTQAAAAVAVAVRAPPMPYVCIWVLYDCFCNGKSYGKAFVARVNPFIAKSCPKMSMFPRFQIRGKDFVMQKYTTANKFIQSMWGAMNRLNASAIVNSVAAAAGGDTRPPVNSLGLLKGLI